MAERIPKLFDDLYASDSSTTEKVPTVQNGAFQRYVKLSDLGSGGTVSFPWVTPEEQSSWSDVSGADNSAAIQEAIDAAKGGTVQLKSATYYATGLIVTNSTAIVGVGWGGTSDPNEAGTVIINSDKTQACITIDSTARPTTGNDGCYLANFELVGNRLTAGATTGDIGLLIKSEGQDRFERVNIRDFKGYGVKFDTASHSSGQIFIGCRIYTNSLDGVYCRTRSGSQINGVTFNRCRVDGNGGNGFNVWMGGASRIDNCLIQSNTLYGINVDGTDIPTEANTMRGLIISGNYMEGNHVAQIRLLTTYNSGGSFSIQDLFLERNYIPNASISATAAVMIDGFIGGFNNLVIGVNSWGLNDAGKKLLSANFKLDNKSVVTIPNIGETWDQYFDGLSGCHVEFTGHKGTTDGVPAKIVYTYNPEYYDPTNKTVWRGYPKLGTSPGDWHIPIITNIVLPPNKLADNPGKTQPDWRPIIPIRRSSVPTSGYWYPGITIENTAASAAGTGWVCTQEGTAYQGTRANSTAYTAVTTYDPALYLWSTGTTVWKCTVAGTTDGSAPSIAGKVVGDTVTDGTVTWQMVDTIAATWATTGKQIHVGTSPPSDTTLLWLDTN